ncbi:MAG: ABC transporter permease, partial [Mesorhizobium sp.]
MSGSGGSPRALPWALVTPALAWTLLFFVLPFV